MNEKVILTDTRSSILKRNENIVRDWERLTSNPGSMKSAVMTQLTRKYRITSERIYVILKTARLRREEKSTKE